MFVLSSFSAGRQDSVLRWDSEFGDRASSRLVVHQSGVEMVLLWLVVIGEYRADVFSHSQS